MSPLIIFNISFAFVFYPMFISKGENLIIDNDIQINEGDQGATKSSKTINA
ncbi:hypothetical protein CECT5772_07303 [Streptococcus equi subsp. ruminatorum CECT 5772]|uniref:Uncharacterized protein n=1 Tax=Streptococcus equi subsp. ruminatorum CECT 5772 TaxID=1051981 RepID=A0A922T5W1_9STRE|nr:hypothetical protein CECT5772_07303 [Streptococcus equi subsp. ruminatorum CECT 5772]